MLLLPVYFEIRKFCRSIGKAHAQALSNLIVLCELDSRLVSLHF